MSPMSSQTQMMVFALLVGALAVLLVEAKEIPTKPEVDESLDASHSGPAKRSLGGGSDGSRFGSGRVLNGANMQNWRAFFDRPERAFGRQDSPAFGRYGDEDMQKWQDFKRMVDMSRRERLRQYGY